MDFNKEIDWLIPAGKLEGCNAVGHLTQVIHCCKIAMFLLFRIYYKTQMSEASSFGCLCCRLQRLIGTWILCWTKIQPAEYLHLYSVFMKLSFHQMAVVYERHCTFLCAPAWMTNQAGKKVPAFKGRQAQKRHPRMMNSPSEEIAIINAGAG